MWDQTWCAACPAGPHECLPVAPGLWVVSLFWIGLLGMETATISKRQWGTGLLLVGGQSLYKLFLERKHSVAQENNFFFFCGQLGVGGWQMVNLLSLFEDAAVFFQIICWTWAATRLAYLQRWSPSFMTGFQYLFLTLPVLSSWGAKEAAVWQDSRLVVPWSCPLWDAFWTGKHGSYFILFSGELIFQMCEVMSTSCSYGTQYGQLRQVTECRIQFQQS